MCIKILQDKVVKGFVDGVFGQPEGGIKILENKCVYGGNARFSWKLEGSMEQTAYQIVSNMVIGN